MSNFKSHLTAVGIVKVNDMIALSYMFRTCRLIRFVIRRLHGSGASEFLVGHFGNRVTVFLDPDVHMSFCFAYVGLGTTCTGYLVYTMTSIHLGAGVFGVHKQ